MHPWRCRGSKEGSEEEGKVQSQDVLHVDCGSGQKHQQRVFSISVTHICGGVSPSVITQSGQAWTRSLGCKTSGTEQHLK